MSTKSSPPGTTDKTAARPRRGDPPAPESLFPEPKPARAPPACSVPDGDPVPVAKGSKVYLVDGSGYIFRAFHALPPLTRPSDGLPVGAVHGFCAMLWKLLEETKASEAPTHFAVVFDASEKTFRNDIYGDYKAHRPPAPEELVPQFPLIREAVRAFNVACLEQLGYEADDLIATYADEAARAGADVIVVSSDKDLMQLVRPGITMFDGMKNKRIGADEVFEKFGVHADRVIDVQALAGDSTDNVPGVPGIGIKTAAELITVYGNLDALLANAGEIKQPKRREKLIEFADQARLSRELVTLKSDVPVEIGLAQLGVQEPDRAALLGFLRRMEFATLTKRIAEKLGAELPDLPAASVGSTVPRRVATTAPAEMEAASPARAEPVAGSPAAGAALHAARLAAVPFDRSKYEIVTDLARLEAWIAVAREAGRCAFDIETTALDCMTCELAGFSLAVDPGIACYVPVGHRHPTGGLDFGDAAEISQAPIRETLALLKGLLEDPAILKIGQNVKFDCLVLARYGVDVAPIDDTMLISYVLDGGRWAHGMDQLSERHLGHAPIAYEKVLEHAPGKKGERNFALVPIERAAEYAAEDADVTLRLWLKLKPRLVSEGLLRVYEALERPLVPVVAGMEKEGVLVDRAVLSKLTSTFAQTLTRLEEEINGLVGHKFNLGSPKQLGELLFDRLKLPGGKRTKSGQWETRAGLLDDLAANEELPEHARKLINTMLEWRQLAKLTSTYTNALPEFVNAETGRIHTSYALAATTTGRLSSYDPNLQNIPIRTKEGRGIRTAFVAGPGNKLVSADYSQIELRVLAHIADIPQLKRAFDEGLDIHAMTASEMFGVPVRDMPGEVRRRAKAINFGIIYGISAFGLANQLGIGREEAGQYIKTYFERFPGIRDYMERTKAFCHQTGYVTTLFGRRIHYPEINTKNPGMRGNYERAAINAPIQGSAADIIRRAMIRMPATLEAEGLASARMLLQVHDELVFEVAEREAEGLIRVAKRVMETASEPAVRLTVPIQVDAKAGPNWDAAH